MGIQIRPAQSHADLHGCVDLQVSVWGFEWRDAVPFNQLHAAHEWGGQVLVAVDGDRLIGFCYGFGGRQYGRPALLSHMLAVLPEYRGQDLGAQLKLAQARWAREAGYDLITWTFDPLGVVNARLNIDRLGGIVRQYLVNHYGEMTDGINRGLPSDRLLVEWHLSRPRVAAILDGAPPPAESEPLHRVPVPRDVQAIKDSDPAAALRWRLQVREQIQAALAEGCAVTGFQLGPEGGTYLLTPERMS
ncbi:MAG: GNAT family N-acetyltransferase [Bacillota bacterium]